jgi:hypothetical protein
MSTRGLEKEQQLKLVGYVSVDSGTVVIVDPCYLNYLVGDEAYDRIWAVTETEPAGQVYQEYDNDVERKGTWEIAVASRTAYGDGTYPVYAKYGQSPVSGKSVVEQLVIDFTGEGVSQ